MLQEGAGGDRDGSCQSQLASEFLPAARQRALRLRSKKLLPGLRGPPRAQQQALGRRGASSPPRGFPPQVPALRLAGGMDG